jgi:hypothetical protein
MTKPFILERDKIVEFCPEDCGLFDFLRGFGPRKEMTLNEAAAARINVHNLLWYAGLLKLDDEIFLFSRDCAKWAAPALGRLETAYAVIRAGGKCFQDPSHEAIEAAKDAIIHYEINVDEEQK